MGDKRRGPEKSKAHRDAVPCANRDPEPDDDAPTMFGPEVPRNRAKPATSTPAPPLPERGGMLGHFVILERLGMGGMAVVYAAFDPGLDRKVAIKLLRPEVGDSWGEEGRHRLLREAVALGKLSHPNVVTVYEVGEVNDQVFIAQEFVQGSDLKQWMGEKPRSRSEILDVFMQAGRGLAAAHAEGITHRDFKPANVFMGADGRARIGDFGLALAEGRDATDSWRGTVSDLRRHWADWDGSLTQTGMLLGTPHYMAPEQLAGLKESPPTDQFSFCVALYEGLYGERPFAGRFLAKLGVSLEENVLAGNVRPAPKSTQVPTWLRGVLLRGLSGLPNERYPTMEALLEELAHDPEEARQQRQATRRRKMLVLGSVALAVCGPIGAWYGINYQRARRCAAAETRFVGVWDSATKERVRRAFLDTQKSFAAGTWQRVERTFDTYTAEWTHMRAEACEATWLSGTQSEEVFDLRMRCLRKRIGELGALVKVFATADAGVVQKAVQASSSLTGVAMCANEEALRAPYPPPKDAEAEAKVAAIRDKLAEVEAFSKTGKYREGLELAEAVLPEAKASGHLPTEAEANYWLGMAQQYVGRYEEARRTLEEAFVAGLRCGHGQCQVDAARMLVFVLGYQLADHKSAQLWARFSGAVLKRIQGSDYQWATWHCRVGASWYARSDFGKALEHTEKCVELLKKSGAHTEPEYAIAVNNLGAQYQNQGRQDQALARYQEALERMEEVLGREHPDLALPLWGLAASNQRRGRFKEARVAFERALAVQEAALGEEHPRLAYTLLGLGDLLVDVKAYNDAYEVCQRAAAIQQKTLGPEHPNLALSLRCSADARRAMDQHGQAIRTYRRALAICEDRVCQFVPVQQMRLGLADSLWASKIDRHKALEIGAEVREICHEDDRCHELRERLETWVGLAERGLDEPATSSPN